MSLDQATLDYMNARSHQASGHMPGKAWAKFDATGGKAIGAHGLGLTLPVGAVITRAFYDVITTFTSATDAGTIALHLNAANDVVSAIAISNAANAWDAGLHITAVIETAATMFKLTADRELTATVAVEALTAGILRVYVEYHFPVTTP